MLKANATAQSIEQITAAMQSDKSSQAVSFAVAREYVEAFGKIAKEGTVVVVPSQIGDVAGMVTSAMSIFSGVSAKAGALANKPNEFPLPKH